MFEKSIGQAFLKLDGLKWKRFLDNVFSKAHTRKIIILQILSVFSKFSRNFAHSVTTFLRCVVFVLRMLCKRLYIISEFRKLQQSGCFLRPEIAIPSTRLLVPLFSTQLEPDLMLILNFQIQKTERKRGLL